MKVVKFDDGMYAIRKWVWGTLEYKYLDLENTEFWWGDIINIDRFCKGALDHVSVEFMELCKPRTMHKDKGTPI